MGNVPIVVEIKPDELLYSWIIRLANVNMLRLYMFGKAYVGQPGIYMGELDYDVKRDFVTLAENLHRKLDFAGEYEKHSTLRFDLMFETERMGMKDINNVLLYPDALNISREKSFTKIYICPECVEEDRRLFGFSYLHVSHHLKGVKACPFHDRMLMEYAGRKGHENEFDLDKYNVIHVSQPEKIYFDYARFAYALFSSGIDAPVEALKEVFVAELVQKGYSLHQEGFEQFNEAFSASEYAPLLSKGVQFCFEQYLIKKQAFAPLDFIPLLMFLFKSPQKIIRNIRRSDPVLINTVCSTCGRTYLSYRDTRHTFNMCRDCYIQIPITTRFNNLVHIAGDGAYKVIGDYTSNMDRLSFQHCCGKISSFVPNNFLYQYSRCECEKQDNVSWKKGYECLKKYHEKYNTGRIPKQMIFDGYKLGAWGQSIRKANKNGKLSSEKQLLLIEIGFDFYPIESEWNKAFEKYVEYVNNTGIGYVKRDQKYDGVSIGSWYLTQRKRFQKGTLDKEKLERIKEVYPEFPHTPSNEIKPKRPRAPKPKTSKLMVVKSKDVKGHKVKKIKPIKVCKVQSHSQNKKAKEVKYHQQPFAETLKLFLEYVKEYGTLIVPKRRVYKDYNLGPWCQQMRSKRRLGILPEEQIKALDEIGFIWDVLGYKWENDMERYRNYVAETGIYDVTATTVYCGFRLGYWYKNLKIARRNGTFSDAQKSDISKIHPHFFDDF